MNVLTPDEASATWLCPLARTFGADRAMEGCRADLCAAWRWKDHSAEILKPHIAARLKEIGGGSVRHKEAVAWVMQNSDELGLPKGPTHGYCGLGGNP